MKKKKNFVIRDKKKHPPRPKVYIVTVPFKSSAMYFVEAPTKAKALALFKKLIKTDDITSFDCTDWVLDFDKLTIAEDDYEDNYEAKGVISKTKYPSEKYEQEQLVAWLEDNNYMFCASMSGAPRSMEQRMACLRAGLRPGFPDMCIVLKCGIPIFIEMKRQKGGRVTPEQKEWLQALDGFVCRGAAEAIALLMKLEQTLSNE